MMEFDRYDYWNRVVANEIKLAIQRMDWEWVFFLRGMFL